MTIHIMLDLETWGTTPGCDIRSIGACVFDPVTGTLGGVPYTDQVQIPLDMAHNGSNDTHFYIACDNLIRMDNAGDDEAVREYPLTRDPQTVQWWSEQSDEAQAAFADPVDLREALRRFIMWLDAVLSCDFGEKVWERTDLRLWSHGPAFDPPILAAAYRAVGLPVPWHYRAPRDTRTAFDMAGIDDHSAWLKQHPGPLGIPHHALDDAICQARAVCGAYDRLKVPHDVVTHRGSWYRAIGVARDLSMGDSESDDTDYYNHEQRVFDDTFDRLASHPRLEQ